MSEPTASEVALNNALKEVDRLREELKAANRRTAFVSEVQKYHENGMLARRSGLSEASAPFANSSGDLHLAYREAWLIGWKEQDEDAWLRNSMRSLQFVLSGLLMVRKLDLKVKKGKTKKKVDPQELEAKWKAAWGDAKEVMERINNGKNDSQG